MDDDVLDDEIELKEKIIRFVSKYQIPITVIVAIVIIIITFFLLSQKKREKQTELTAKIDSSARNKNPQQESPFLPLPTEPFLSNSSPNQASSSSSKGNNEVLQNKIINSTSSATHYTSPSFASSTPPSIRKNSTSSSSQSTQTTSQNSTSSHNSSSTSNPASSGETQFQIVFLGSNNQPQVYIPPIIPPLQVVWNTYRNALDAYSIEYPANWQLVKYSYYNHEGIGVFPPGQDTTAQNAVRIGLGWSVSYTLPDSGGRNAPYVTPISVSNLAGTLYTQGALGSSYIASIFPYLGGYFGIASNVSTTDITYVYDHMLKSLKFY